MNVLVSGASGLLGTRVVPQLERAGHRVIRLVRAAPGRAGERRWDPVAGQLDLALDERIDAVVHLAGEPIGARWTAARRRRIRDSRVRGTETLACAIAALARPPRVMLSMSAVGVYGARGDALLDEDAGPGRGFLAEVGQAWEAACGPARAAGVRVVHPRLGLVLSRTGGALAAMLPAFRLGLGGRLGDGRQFWSWITLDDAARALLHLLGREDAHGAFNVAAPAPLRQADFAAALGRALGRPARLPAPAWALRLALGAMADELLLASARVSPARLVAAGFSFEHPELEPALRHVLHA